MSGFHIGVRGKAAGQAVRCTAREGACKLTGADGEPTPHFASLADGEAHLAQQENAYKGGFTAANNNASNTSDDADAAIDYSAMSAATCALSALLGYIATEAIFKRIRGRN